MPRSKRFPLRLVLGWLTLAPFSSYAQIALVDYDAVNESQMIGTNPAQSGVFIKNVCVIPGDESHFRVCTPDDISGGNTGVVIQQDSHLSGKSKKELNGEKDKSWIILPFNENIYGTDEKNARTILANHTVVNAQRKNALDNPELKIKDQLSPNPEPIKKQSKEDQGQNTYQGKWKYAISASSIRTTHTISMQTTPEQDQAAVDFLNDPKSRRQFQLLNPAKFANELMTATFGSDAKGKKRFHGRGHVEDAGSVTTSSVTKGMIEVAKAQNIPYQVEVYNQIPTTYKPSASGTELTTDSGSGIALAQLTRLIPSPPVVSAGIMFAGLKFGRKMGMSLPGFRRYVDIEKKETLEHGSPELAEISFELDEAKRDKDAVKAHDLKLKRQLLQNTTFGTKACWKDKRNAFQELISDAIKANVIDQKYEKDFQLHYPRNHYLRMMPILHLNPTHAKLIGEIMDSPSTHINTDAMTIEKDGITAGLTRENIERYDPKLGFLVMAASIVYQLDSDQTILTSEFDADWSTLIKLAQRSGIVIDHSLLESVQTCSTKSDPSIETPAAAPGTGSTEASETTCAE